MNLININVKPISSPMNTQTQSDQIHTKVLHNKHAKSKTLASWRTGILAVIATLAATALWAQPGMDFNNRHLAQSNSINPGFIPQYGFTFGGSILTHLYSPAFSAKDIFDPAMDAESTIKQFIRDPKKAIGLQGMVYADLLHASLKIKRNYFAYSAGVNLGLEVAVPKDLVGLAMFGNAEYRDRPANIDFSGNKLNLYAEQKITFSRQITNKLTVGANYSFINGIADFSINKAYASIKTDTNTQSFYGLEFGAGADIRYSLLGVNIEQILKDTNGSYDPGQIAADNAAKLLSSNKGNAYGFGAVLRMNKHIRLSASATNMGSITWNLGAEQFKLKDATFKFSGIDTTMQDSISNLSNILLDTLRNTFTYSTVSGGSYVQQLHPRYVLGIEYFVTPRTYLQFVGGTGFGINGDKSFVSVNAHQEIWELLDLRFGYTRYDFNNPLTTVSIGSSLNLGPFQPWFNVSTTGLIAAVDDVRYFNMRLGFNLNIGWCKDRDNDGVKDRKDSCYKTFGVRSNNGCVLGYLGPALKYDGTDDVLTDSSLIMYIDTTPQKDYRAKPKKVDEATLIVEKVETSGSATGSNSGSGSNSIPTSSSSNSNATSSGSNSDSSMQQGTNPYAIDEEPSTGKPAKKKAKAPKKSKAKSIDLNDAMY